MYSVRRKMTCYSFFGRQYSLSFEDDCFLCLITATGSMFREGKEISGIQEMAAFKTREISVSA